MRPVPPSHKRQLVVSSPSTMCRVRYIASRAERLRSARNSVWAFNLGTWHPFPARGADALLATLYEQFTLASQRTWPNVWT